MGKVLNGWLDHPLTKLVFPLIVAGIVGLIVMYGTVGRIDVKFEERIKALCDSVARLELASDTLKGITGKLETNQAVLGQQLRTLEHAVDDLERRNGK